MLSVVQCNSKRTAQCLGSIPTACATDIFSAYQHEPKHENTQTNPPPRLSGLTVCRQTTNSSDHCSMYRSAPSMCRIEIGSLVTMASTPPSPRGGGRRAQVPPKLAVKWTLTAVSSQSFCVLCAFVHSILWHNVIGATTVGTGGGWSPNLAQQCIGPPTFWP